MNSGGGAQLKSTVLAIGSGLWETVGMAKAIKAGQIVVLDGLVGVYRVLAVFPGRTNGGY